MGQKYLIIGASAGVGKEITENLKAQGAEVLAATSKKTTDKNQVHIDLKTGEGLKEVFARVDRAFLLSPAGHADQYKVLSPLIQQAKASNLKKVVLMTAMGVDANSESPLRRAELDLEKSGLNYNIIRPNWFMQNLNTFWLQDIRDRGVIALPTGTAKASFIDTRDIAAVATKLLTTDNLNNRAFVLTGPEAIDHTQIAQGISEVTGKKVIYKDTDPADTKKYLMAAGLSEDYVNVMLMIFGFLKAGYNATVTNDVQQVLGRAPSSFQKYLQDYKKSW